MARPEGNAAVGEAVALMEAFAERTGLASGSPAQRYLWTDAFAVCNFLGLARATGEDRFRDLALRLVDRVHRALGRHRADDPRTGWISGLGEEEGARYPTRGGLRIGKPLPERTPDAPADARLEWDRDGQYFHYLTKWMHALDQVARATGEARFDTWARELMESAHRTFTVRGPGGAPRMVWKMSVDLSRPLVPSMGHHDPLDGLVTTLELRATASRLPGAPAAPRLDAALADFEHLVAGGSWATADPLGAGGLLMDACRVARLVREGALADARLLETLLAAAQESLPHCAAQDVWGAPATRRLAFRELGLAIGLAGLGPIGSDVRDTAGLPDAERLRARLVALCAHRRLGAAIATFWREPAHRETRLWWEHRDIDDVMLATCLVPQGFFELPPLPAAS